MKAKFLFLFLASGLVWFNWSCCGHSSCDCFDEIDRALHFRFKVDTLKGGFSVAEIDTFLIRKLTKGTHLTLDSEWYYLDTVDFLQYKTFDAKYGFYMNDNRILFDRNFDDFDYEIVVSGLKTFSVKNIVITGHIVGRCCTCYTNDHKSLELDGKQMDLTESYGNPKYVILAK